MCIFSLKHPESSSGQAPGAVLYYGEWCRSPAGKKEVYFFFPSSEKRGEADVPERKNVQESNRGSQGIGTIHWGGEKPAVRPTSLGGRLAGAKFVLDKDDLATWHIAFVKLANGEHAVSIVPQVALL